jgi:hypothetical protein
MHAYQLHPTYVWAAAECAPHNVHYGSYVGCKLAHVDCYVA